MYVHIREKKKRKKVALQYHLYALNYNNLVDMCMLLILVAKNSPSPQEEGGDKKSRYSLSIFSYYLSG